MRLILNQGFKSLSVAEGYGRFAKGGRGGDVYKVKASTYGSRFKTRT